MYLHNLSLNQNKCSFLDFKNNYFKCLNNFLQYKFLKDLYLTIQKWKLFDTKKIFSLINLRKEKSINNLSVDYKVNSKSKKKLLKQLKKDCFKPGVDKLRPLKCKSAACKLVFYLN